MQIIHVQLFCNYYFDISIPLLRAEDVIYYPHIIYDIVSIIHTRILIHDI
jgi:hypothetical protein